MKLALFSVQDLKAGVFLSPFPARSAIDAKRQIAASFENSAMRDTPVAKNPEDFRLMHVGSFDDESGEITAVLPLLIAEMSELAPVGTVRS